MGDTDRSDVTTSDVTPDEKDDIKIEFPIKEGSLTDSEDDTPREPPLKISEEKLFKNSNNNESTVTEISPDPINSSIPSGSGQSTPRRHHNRQNLFDEPKPLPNQEIFSVNGQRGVKLPRHQDNVSCFPSGCMGVKDEEILSNEEASPRVEEEPAASNSVLTQEQKKQILQKPETAPKKNQHLHTIARNPLTGEGYEDKDFVTHTGNPLSGHGYIEQKKSKPSKIPPGGYSKGLW